MPDKLATATTERATVDTAINYVSRTNERMVYYPHDFSRHVMKFESTPVVIENARLLSDPPRLDREGLERVTHETAVSDFTNTDAIVHVYAPEIRALVQDVSGADEVVVIAEYAMVRFSEGFKEKHDDDVRPARFPHLDFTPAATRMMAEKYNPRPGQPFKRCAAINVWRALSAPPQDTPLAICDSRSIDQADLGEFDAILKLPGQDETVLQGWGFAVHANPAHRWLYYPDMTRDEALVFKVCDTDTQSAPHSAFDDPSAPADAVPRSSVEMRSIAYWY